MALSSGGAAVGEEARRLARAILDSAGVEPGPALCVHLDCGDGRLTSELARAGKFLVHGLSADERTVAETRKSIQSAGIYGRASVARCSLKELPYSDNMVNLVVAEDMAKLLDRGLTLREVMRVICPLGVAYLGWPSFRARELKKRLTAAGIEEYEVVRDRGVWVRILKPWPKEMDEWNHWRNDADGNPASKDTMVGPPARIRWLAHPRWCLAGGLGQIRVSADGRLFYLSGWGVPGVKYDKNPHYLMARDAFNGLLLWKRRFPATDAGDSHGRGEFPVKRTVVAAGDRVYAVLDAGKPLECLDARTGETLITYEKAGCPAQVLYVDDALILTGGGPVRSVDPETGRQRWRSKHSTDHIIAGEGRVFFQGKSAGFVCLDVKTGKELWQANLGFGGLQFYREGILFFRARNTTYAVSARDGKRLWSYSGPRRSSGKAPRRRTPNMFFSQGLCWNNMAGAGGKLNYYLGLDPLTGKEVKRVLHTGFGTRCFPDFFSEHYVFATDFNCLNLKTGEYHHGAGFARPSCGSGGFAANGLFYPFVNTCMCYQQLRGMIAVAPAKPGGPRKAEKLKDRYEKGSAYGRTQGVAWTGSEGDWPTYRHDAFRTGGTTTSVPAGLKQLWSAKLGDRITAPVTSGGKVFIASIDSHRVFALDERSGKPLWSYTASGRMCLPPTIFEGLCLFGSLDGWVTCLKAEDGELVWRFRAAPEARQIMAYEQLESPWPVYGVLVRRGAAYFAAGRSSDADGGVHIYGVEPHLGTILWEKHHRTRSWSYKRDVKTERFVWMQPRAVEGVSIRSNPQEWTLKNVPTIAGKYCFSEGGAYKADPDTGRVVWMTDKELQGSPEKAAWKTWKSENLKDVIGGTSLRRRELLVVDIPVADTDYFHIKAVRFGYKDGESRYSGGGGGLKSVRGGATLMDNVNAWRCYSWMSHKQYYGDGRPLVYDDKWAYGSRPPQRGQSRMDIIGKGVRIRAWPKASVPRTPDNKRRKKKMLWDVRDVPLRTLAMVLTDQVLFVAGVSDEGITEDLPPEQFWGRLEGKDGGVLYAFSKTDGRILSKQKLEEMPVFDGLAAANGRLYLTTEDGKLLCFGKEK